MDLKSKLMNEVQYWTQNITDNQTVQDIIQKTFLWIGGMLFTTFAIWYYVVYLIKTWVISVWSYTVAFWVSIIWALWLIIAITWGYRKMSYSILAVLTEIFAILEWVWLAWILSTYNAESVINAFAWASLLFVSMAVYGYTTKKDITELWTMLTIWLIVALIISVVNIFFIQSTWLETVLSLVFIFIFLWFTAWDIQMLKIMAQSWDRRLEMVFWISLYLNFINIFIQLLEIFWNQND